MSGLAIVGRITSIRPHPDPEVTKMEVIRFNTFDGPFGPAEGGHLRVELVTGKHYRVGDLGVWLRPGALIPGWLANHLWQVGKKKASDSSYRFTVMAKELRGAYSPGMWIGSFYQTDTSAESHDHARELKEFGGIETFRDAISWITPHYWNPQWRVGDTVDTELGVEAAPVPA